MKVTPDDYGRRCQFDHFCKLVLYHEAVDYFRERKRQRGWETSFETLPLSELDTLCTIPPEQRMMNYLEQVKNPYLFRCGDAVVSVRFSAGGTALDGLLKNYFSGLKKG